MKIKMTNKRFVGAANVLPDDVPTWEAAGWVAEQSDKKSSETKTTPKKRGKTT